MTGSPLARVTARSRSPSPSKSKGRMAVAVALQEREIIREEVGRHQVEVPVAVEIRSQKAPRPLPHWVLATCGHLARSVVPKQKQFAAEARVRYEIGIRIAVEVGWQDL